MPGPARPVTPPPPPRPVSPAPPRADAIALPHISAHEALVWAAAILALITGAVCLGVYITMPGQVLTHTRDVVVDLTEGGVLTAMVPWSRRLTLADHAEPTTPAVTVRIGHGVPYRPTPQHLWRDAAISAGIDVIPWVALLALTTVVLAVTGAAGIT